MEQSILFPQCLPGHARVFPLQNLYMQLEQVIRTRGAKPKNLFVCQFEGNMLFADSPDSHRVMGYCLF